MRADVSYLQKHYNRCLLRSIVADANDSPTNDSPANHCRVQCLPRSTIPPADGRGRNYEDFTNARSEASRPLKTYQSQSRVGGDHADRSYYDVDLVGLPAHL